MTKHHYVYKSYEEEGREYIGIRSCNCLPEEDIKYFGSFRDKTFKPTGKTILFVCKTRIEASEIEIELHDFFNVAVNPQFANKAKQTSTKFDMTGVPHTEEWKKAISERMVGKYIGENHPMFNVPRTEEVKKKISKANSGKTRTEAQNKANSERNSGEKHSQYGRTGALSACSKAIIAIQPDGIELHFGSGREAARELEIDSGNLYTYLNTGHVLTRGPFKGWQFIYQNP